MFDIYIDKNPLYTCSVCDAKVRVTVRGEQEPLIERTCEHASAPVHANAAARVTQKGGMAARIEHAIKTKVGQAFTALLGRSVIWR